MAFMKTILRFCTILHDFYYNEKLLKSDFFEDTFSHFVFIFRKWDHFWWILTVWVSQMLFCINIQMVWHVFKNRVKAGVQLRMSLFYSLFWISIFVLVCWDHQLLLLVIHNTINILNWQNKKSNSDLLWKLLLIDQIVLWQFFILCCDIQNFKNIFLRWGFNFFEISSYWLVLPSEKKTEKLLVK